MGKKIIEYIIPIQDKEEVDRVNKMCREMFGDNFTPYLTTEEHIDILVDKFLKAIITVGDDYGWYCGDDIKVKIEIEYRPENK